MWAWRCSFPRLCGFGFCPLGEELTVRLLDRVPGDDAIGEELVGRLAFLAAERLRAHVAEVARDLLRALAASQHPADTVEVRVVGVRARRVVVHVQRIPVLDGEHTKLPLAAFPPPASPAKPSHQFRVTQTPPSPAAMPRGRPSSEATFVARFVAGSIRATVSSPQATHTADSPYATASALLHAFTFAVIRLRSRGSRSTVPSDLLIQTESAPRTTPVGD